MLFSDLILLLAQERPAAPWDDWKTPRSTAPVPAPTPTLVGGVQLAPGDVVEAKGAAPAGGRAWFQAKVVALRLHFPPIHVKYVATLEGVTTRLALPEPVSAYLHADDVRRPGA